VKQRCVSEQFIAINHNMEMVAGILYQTEGEGKRARRQRDQKRKCVSDRALQREENGVGNEIDL
jgi:hypothetical protein